MNRIVSLIRFVISTAFPNQQPPPPTIESYGQNLSGMSDQQIQPIMEWLFLSLIKAGYSDRAHLIWYNDADPDPDLRQAMKEALQLEEPTFLAPLWSENVSTTGWLLLADDAGTSIDPDLSA